MIKEKKTRRVLLLSLTAVLAAAGMGIIGYHIQHRATGDGIHYTDDYPLRYRDQLRIIFGEGAQIGEKETVVVEGEDCDCGYHSDPYVYDQWTVTYPDQKGQIFTQTLENMSGLEAQQLSWLKEHLRQYYLQRYVIDFFDEGTFEDLTLEQPLGKSYCSIHIGNPVHSYTSAQKEAYERAQAAGKRYDDELLERLKKEETMLCLSQIQYREIFDHFPIEVCFHLSMDDGTLTGAEKEAFEKRVQEQVQAMIQTIVQETDGACNLRIQVNSANGHYDLYDGAKDWRYFILRGEPVRPEDLFDGFEWQLFHAYGGVYW